MWRHDLDILDAGPAVAVNVFDARVGQVDVAIVVGQLVLAGPPSERRAIAHPAPTPRVCQLATARGPTHIFANSGSTIVRQVPLEAFRRFQNDQRIRHG